MPYIQRRMKETESIFRTAAGSYVVRERIYTKVLVRQVKSKKKTEAVETIVVKYSWYLLYVQSIGEGTHELTAKVYKV